MSPKNETVKRLSQEVSTVRVLNILSSGRCAYFGCSQVNADEERTLAADVCLIEVVIYTHYVKRKR